MPGRDQGLLDHPQEPRISLRRQFMLLAAIVVAGGMIVIGLWVRREIEHVVIGNSGAVTALYVDAMIAPAAQELDTGAGLSPEGRGRLEEILGRGALRDEIYRFKLWSREGEILYSDDPAIVGRRFALNVGLSEAIAGGVHAGISRASHDEDADRIPEDLALLEIYSPLRSSRTGEVIAVAEFYTGVETLGANLAAARRKVWLVVGAVSLAMCSAFFVLFSRGSRTILRQRRALDAQIRRLSALLARNRELSERVDQANRRIATVHERNLRRISAELHDGPAQHLAFAALRLDGSGDARHQQVQGAVNEALREIRNICQGFAVPELENLSVAQIARRLALAHEDRANNRVGLVIDGDLPDLSLAAKTCLYRFLQEALNNSMHHAPGVPPRVVLRPQDGGLMARVRDDGPGFDTGNVSEGLGLPGLRERVAGLKGRFELRSKPGEGTDLSIWLPLDAGEEGADR
ncbi:sensor histidine kinase [Pseudogemmobacter sonorensis]|uniref:sensor histidine kinase n=1 Tax=Pseudogemmobacter sonorensis TaxID=2989681 RepID=UPI003694556F